MMLDLVLIPLLMQLSTASGSFSEQEYSAATIDAIAERDEADGERLARALERLGEAGDASAYEALGEIFTNGVFGVAADPARGCDYYAKVGDARADALHNLATCYYYGNGRKQDLAKAREIYLKAAEKGWRMSFCAYGNMLVRGEGGPVEAAEGIRLCRMTAALGDADAQTDYGTYLLTGTGIERDPVAARFMLEQAGAQGQRNAAFLLGQIHTKGDGTPADDKLASEWFARAYEYGRPDAAFEAAKSFLRRGYTSKENGGATLDPALLRQGLEWAEKAKSIETDDERAAGVLELEHLLSRLLIAADRAASD